MVYMCAKARCLFYITKLLNNIISYNNVVIMKTISVVYFGGGVFGEVIVNVYYSIHQKDPDTK